MHEQEIPLEGGNVTQVMRVGDTVRRNPGFWTPAVHGLLEHLAAQGFEGAPRPLGYDQQGREILTYIEGEAGSYPLPAYMWREDTLTEVARFLRRYHDATLGYVAPGNLKWQFQYPDRSQHEVICHNDFAPYNLIFVNEQPHALIDFDSAGPGPRLWDIAYAAHLFVPLSYYEEVQKIGLADPTVQSLRLRLFCDAYGLELEKRANLLDMVEQTMNKMIEWLVKGAENGNLVIQRMVAEGHAKYHQNELAAFRQHRSQLQF